MNRLAVFVASVGFLGYLPFASGTFGSLAAIPLYGLFDCLRETSTGAYLFLFAALVGAACWFAGETDEILGEKDSHKIVIDEVAGYLAATLFLPFTCKTALVAFFVFRALDVVKPFPAGHIDRKIPGGPGVVFDDVVSGFYSNLLTRVILAYI